MKNNFNEKRRILHEQKLKNHPKKISTPKNINNFNKMNLLPKGMTKEIIEDNDTITFKVSKNPTDHYVYEKKNKTFILDRWAGIGSNCSVIIYFLIELKAYYDIVPENISTKLYLYKNYNLYDDILYINKEQINNFKKIDNKYLLSFLEKNQLGCWGIGSDKNNLDFNLIRVILKSYFNFTDSVKNRANKIIKKYNINLNNSNFIYWRRTDHPYELAVCGLKYPELSEAIEILKDNKNNTIAQTDDQEIFLELKKQKNIKVLEELPLCANADGGQHHEFLKETNTHDEKYHVLTIMAIIYIASKVDTFVGYPGNLSWMISNLRKFKKTYFIKTINSIF